MDCQRHDADLAPRPKQQHDYANMKTNAHRLLSVLATALLGAAAVLNTQAQTWQTILPIPEFAPGWSGHALLFDPFSANPANPGVFVGCWSDDPLGVGSILHLSPDGTPMVMDTDLDRVYGLGYNPAAGTLYAVGNRGLTWKVRKSSVGGGPNTWTEDDTFFLSAKTEASARAITTDSLGNVYVCGVALPARGNSHWIVRKLPLGGSWTSVVDLAGKSGAVSVARGMCFYPGRGALPPALFAVGMLDSKWTVLRSQNQGANWQVVDGWSPSKNLAATADEIAYDSYSGNLYVVGFRGDFTTPAGWVAHRPA